jgi:uncharacterized damage-inducible protein DinB
MTPMRNVVLACCLALSLPALAQGTAPTTPSPAAAPAPTFQTDVVGVLGQVQQEMVSLEQAMPQNKFSWRPAKGVRSVGEVYVHAAGSAYWFGKQLGFQVPEGVQAKMKDLEKSTDKAQIEKALTDSFTWFAGQVKAMPDSELTKTVSLMGHDLTKRAVIMITMGHYQEHLGQSIAYARMNGVVPPWSKNDKS